MIIDDESIIAELTAVSERYETALLSNDTATLDALFWQDPRVLRVSPKEEQSGIDAIRRYRSARSTTELAREYLSRQITSFGADTGFVNIVFRRHSDQRIGRQSQAWMRLDGEWRIVHAHIGFRES